MDPVISGLLDDLPDKPPRSKLEAHADVITTLRRKRRTYREIAQFFREHLSITVSPSTIHDFVRVRRGRKNGKPTRFETWFLLRQNVSTESTRSGIHHQQTRTRFKESPN